MLSDEKKGESLLRLMEQHWLHCRHIEYERSWFMIYYAIAVTGGSISSISLSDSNLSTIFIGSSSISWLFYFILLFTFFGFFQNLRWSQAFEKHRITVNSLVIEIIKVFNLQVSDRDLLTMKIPPMEGLWKVKGIFRTRYLFPLFYLSILILFVVFFEGGVRYGASVALIIALILGFRARASFKRLDTDDKDLWSYNSISRSGK
ncbi:MAG: hypothetical protein HXS54_18690 [Theionarchaea archaeon]|nr:hypothetical protein [Theionarchaea archaeon]